MRIFLRMMAAAGIVLPMLFSCKTIPLRLDKGPVVAKVGRHRLYRSDVESMIPGTVSSRDSIALASRYIDAWASDMIFSEVAQSRLSKSERDVSRELEDYRRSLLKYRYEQHYVNERLDTSVTEDEVAAYYKDKEELFALEVPIMKVRYMRIASDSPNLGLLKKKMSSSDVNELVEADSIAYFSAERYTDFSGKWITAVQLARNFGTDYGTLLSKSVNSLVEMKDAGGKMNIAYVVDFVPAGETAPIEYCREKIKDIIISRRKQTLISDLERELIEDARASGTFESF